MEAILALEDGTVVQRPAAGAEGETGGEVVFNTSMTGYQEVLTDPSYSGQIVTMTCPEIGNYGVSGRRRRVARAAGGRLHHPRRVAGREQLARGDARSATIWSPTRSSRSPTSTRARSRAGCARAA